MIERHVYCEDALDWFDKHQNLCAFSLVTSLPDISEFPHYNLEQWQAWFLCTAKLLLSKYSDEGVGIFYQSDIKQDGAWIDKGYLCQKAAQELGQILLWHKIVCKTDPGIATFGTPAYSHILCFSKTIRLTDLSKSTPDIIPHLGEKTWQRGIGLTPALMIARFVLEQTNTRTIINPFCGEGSILAAANATGLSSIGIERSPKRAKKAKILEVSPDQKKWIVNNIM